MVYTRGRFARDEPAAADAGRESRREGEYSARGIGADLHDGPFPAGVVKISDPIDMLVIGETQVTVLPAPAG
jgi:hypothetical protein